MKPISTVGETVLPAGTFTFLRQAVRKEAGPLGATHALHGAGYAAGDPLLEAFRGVLGTGPIDEVKETRFWDALSEFFQERGWGRLHHERVHPAMAILTSGNWMEADDSGGESQPGCAFSCGVLANILSAVAGGPIAVLEVGCRSRGDESCSFLFGSEEAIHETYGHLLDGASLERALART